MIPFHLHQLTGGVVHQEKEEYIVKKTLHHADDTFPPPLINWRSPSSGKGRIHSEKKTLHHACC